MSSKQATVDHIVEQLAGLDVRSRQMFGEYAIYCDEKVTAFVCDDSLFVKILPANAELADGLKTGPAYPGSKDYYIVPSDKLEDSAWLRQLISTTAAGLPAKKR